jgi:hypothetical protein
MKVVVANALIVAQVTVVRTLNLRDNLKDVLDVDLNKERVILSYNAFFYSAF